MKQIFENTGGNQFKIKNESLPDKSSFAIEQKVTAALSQLENDDEFMAYLHKYPEVHFRQTLRDSFSFVIVLKRA